MPLKILVSDVLFRLLQVRVICKTSKAQFNWEVKIRVLSISVLRMIQSTYTPHP